MARLGSPFSLLRGLSLSTSAQCASYEHFPNDKNNLIKSGKNKFSHVPQILRKSQIVKMNPEKFEFSLGLSEEGEFEM